MGWAVFGLGLGFVAVASASVVVVVGVGAAVVDSGCSVLEGWGRW